MGNRSKPYNSKEWLTKRWVTDGKTLEEIAKEARVSVQTIRNALAKHGLIKK